MKLSPKDEASLIAMGAKVTRVNEAALGVKASAAEAKHLWIDSDIMYACKCGYRGTLPVILREGVKCLEECPCCGKRMKPERKAKKPVGASAAHALFIAACRSHGLPEPTPEFKFHPVRKWRFDWAWVNERVSLEIEGGAFHGPGHRSVGVFLRNMEKYNAAAIAGWRVVRVTTKDMATGAVFQLLKQALGVSQ